MNKVLKFVCAFAVIFAVEALLFASFASAAATVTDPASAEPAVSTSYILFTGNHAEILNGVAYHTFRIPAVVRTNAGTLLAFAEGRANSKVDWGNINVLYKRSINNGQTAEDWSLLIQAASIGLDTGGNPTPVVDRQTGTIWLFMSWNSANTSQKGMLNPDSHLPTKPVSQWVNTVSMS
jgi:sialidase-1